MKNTLYVILFLVITSCTFEKEKKKDHSSTVKDTTQKRKYESAYKIIYSNSSCLDWSIETLPILELKSNTIDKGDSIRGKLYFSSNYLRQLAKCNNLDYKISFILHNSNGQDLVFFTKNASDTINFVHSYDSLNKINQTKISDEYLFKGTLKASFYKGNKVLGYDTMMSIRKNIIIKTKKQSNRR